MTQEELQNVFEELKGEGMEDEDIVVALGRMYEEGEITKPQLGALLDGLGYEFTPEFAEKSDEESKASLWEKDGEGDEGGKEDPKPEPKPEPEPEDDGEERRKAFEISERRKGPPVPRHAKRNRKEPQRWLSQQTP